VPARRINIKYITIRAEKVASPVTALQGPLAQGDLGPHLTQCGRGQAYLYAKFHLDPSNRLATVYQRHRQKRTDRTDNGPIAQRNRLTNGGPTSGQSNLTSGRITSAHGRFNRIGPVAPM